MPREKSIAERFEAYVEAVGARLHKPNRRFLRDALFGLLENRSTLLSEIGRALDEPRRLIHTEKRLSRGLASRRYNDAAVEANYLKLVVAMLDAQRSGRPLFLGLGTHDVDLVVQAADHAHKIGLSRAAFDVEMLYGIRVDQQRRLQAEGYTVRVLIAYGEAWYPWYMRRLAERPANVIFALRQLLP